jgi:hypothetical protein
MGTSRGKIALLPHVEYATTLETKEPEMGSVTRGRRKADVAAHTMKGRSGAKAATSHESKLRRALKRFVSR